MSRKLSQQEFIEISKCRQSVVYFLSKYAYIKDPVRGRIKFNLFKYQEICLNKFCQFLFNIILKSRQMGLSWLVSGYILWLSLFHEDKKTLMISIKESTARALLKKVKYIYKNLPDFLQIELTDDNLSRMSFVNGREIESVPTSEVAGRSESLSLLVIDESAFVRWIEDIWTAAYPTLSTGGQAILLSTPNGMGNFYYEKWIEAVEGRSLFNPIRLHWYYHPDRDLNWFNIQKANMNRLQLAQEVLGDFIASGNLVFDLTALRAMQEECSMITPLEIIYPDEPDVEAACGLYIFDKPDRGNTYLLSADTAKGGTGDYNAAHVIDRTSGLQVAEYRTRVPLELFNRRLTELGLLYNGALAAVENNNMGIATNLHLMNNNYPSIYEYEDPLRGGRKELGFPTNSMTRPILIDELERSIRENVAGVRGLRTVNELMSFAWNKKGKAEALQGKHDDLVMSLGIARYVRRMKPAELSLPVIYA